MVTGPEYAQILICVVAVIAVAKEWVTGLGSIILSGWAVAVLGLILINHFWFVATSAALVLAIAGCGAIISKHSAKKRGRKRYV
jgi:hypothetical protein